MPSYSSKTTNPPAAVYIDADKEQYKRALLSVLGRGGVKPTPIDICSMSGGVIGHIIDADAEQTKHAEIKPRVIRDIITA